MKHVTKIEPQSNRQFKQTNYCWLGRNQKKQLPITKTPSPDGFTRKTSQNFKGQKKPMLFKLLQNLEKEMKILNSFYEITTTLVPKSNKDKTD